MRFLVFLISFLVGSAALAGDYKIATVDMQVLLKKYPGTAPAQLRFDTLAAKKKEELGESEKLLADLESELKSSSGIMSEEERNTKADEYRAEARSYEDKKQRVEQELSDRSEEVSQALLDQIKVIVAKIAQKKGLNLVVDSKSAVSTSSDLDLTQEVLESFDKLNPKDFVIDSTP